MNLLFEITKNGLRYGTFNSDNELIYDGFHPLTDWSSRSVSELFKTQLLAKLRAHGKLFTKIGIVIPFADSHYVDPTPASQKLLQQLGSTQVRKKVLEPVILLLAASEKSWPHLPHYFLYDTCLSHQLTREVVLPPFEYDFTKHNGIHPYVVSSYGHKANLAKIKTGQLAVSLYIGEQTSCVLFDGHRVIDAIATYSPLSPIMGLFSAGSFDPGLYLALSEKKKLTDVQKLFTEQAGLIPMSETKYEIDALLQIAGMVKRDDSVNLDNLSIETIEWIELSLRSYIRSLRHAAGSLMAYSSDVKTLVVNTSVVPESSGLWKVFTQNRLSELKLGYCATSLLQAACHDLNRQH